jgi:ubiquinol-cytochrome c reductase core subunit 2
MILAFPGSCTFTGNSYKPEIPVLAALLGGQSNIKWSPGFSLLSKATEAHPGAHIVTSHAAYSDAGLLCVSITGNAAHVAEASHEVVKTIKKIAAGEISKEDIKKAIAAARLKALESGESLVAGMELTGAGLVQSGKAHQLDEVAKGIEGVTEAQVKAVSNHFFSCNSMLIMIITGCKGTTRSEGNGFVSRGSVCASMGGRTGPQSLKRL